MKMLNKCVGFLRLSIRNKRQCTTLPANTEKPRERSHAGKMQAWQIHSYGGIDEVKLYSVKMPIISKRNEVIVRVEAASVNPIDIAMTNGYGATTINLMRKARNLEAGFDLLDPLIEFPLTMGRDFSGTVVSKGHAVGDRLQLGDKVWGVVPVEQQGCHATHVVVDDSMVLLKPDILSSVEAASIPYAGLTAWSALWITGCISCRNLINTSPNRSVLVIGGSGGVGTMAIQLLKAWNMRVVTTCREDFVKKLEELGADIVIDYKGQDADSHIISEGPYHIVLDCANQGVDSVTSKGIQYDTFITLNSPLLSNVDTYGLIGGAVKNIGDLVSQNLPKGNHLSNVRWGFFLPCATGLEALQKLVEKRKLTPVVSEVFPFSKLPEAYKRVSEGHLRGKIVIDMTLDK